MLSEVMWGMESKMEVVSRTLIRNNKHICTITLSDV